MALAYSQFGLASPVLYAAYLRTHYDGDCSDPVVVAEGVSVGTVGSVACESGGEGTGGLVALGDAEAVFALRTLRAGGERWSNRVNEYERRCGAGFGQASFALHDGVAHVGSSECDVAGKVFGTDASVGDDNAQFGSSRSEKGIVRGKWYKKNKARKEKLRDRRVTRLGLGLKSVGENENFGKKVDDHVQSAQGDCGCGIRGDSSKLRLSLEKKWVVENALAEERAKQQLELLMARDLDSVKRMQRAQVLRTTETCKVQTEKAFSTLKRTGNVAGFAETVVSEPSLTDGSTARSNGECISPDSSVSQQEIRRMQQENFEMQRALDKVKENDPKLHAFAVRMGGLKSAFTLDTDGEIPVDDEGEIGADGKFHIAYPRENVVTRKQQAAMDEEYERYLIEGDNY